MATQSLSVLLNGIMPKTTTTTTGQMGGCESLVDDPKWQLSRPPAVNDSPNANEQTTSVRAPFGRRKLTDRPVQTPLVLMGWRFTSFFILLMFAQCSVPQGLLSLFTRYSTDIWWQYSNNFTEILQKHSLATIHYTILLYCTQHFYFFLQFGANCFVNIMWTCW